MRCNMLSRFTLQRNLAHQTLACRDTGNLYNRALIRRRLVPPLNAKSSIFSSQNPTSDREMSRLSTQIPQRKITYRKTYAISTKPQFLSLSNGTPIDLNHSSQAQRFQDQALEAILIKAIQFKSKSQEFSRLLTLKSRLTQNI